jgi:hypothetical protein
MISTGSSSASAIATPDFPDAVGPIKKIAGGKVASDVLIDRA